MRAFKATCSNAASTSILSSFAAGGGPAFAFAAATLLIASGSLYGQEPAPYTPPEKLPAQIEPAAPTPAKPAPPAVDAAPSGQEQPPAPKGKVLFERKDTPAAEDQPAEPAATPATGESSSQPMPDGRTGPSDANVTVSDEEREAVTFTAYDLDLHLVPAKSGIEAQANFIVRNDGKAPLTQIPVQVSSSLAWDSLRVRLGAAGTFVQHRINTDADHTGVAREAVLTLPEPLKPGASIDLSAIYSGSLPQSGERLERIGAPMDEAIKADWDRVSAEGTALRGYGNVMWYPVAGAPVFLGDGAKLFDSVGRAKLRQQAANARLRVTVEYAGDAPDAAYFCGRRELFSAVSDNDDLPIAQGRGVATAEFHMQPLGFRTPSLFLTDKAATTTDGALIRAVTDQNGVLGKYAEAAAKVQPLLVDWLGLSPLAPLDVLDLPAVGDSGQPFSDGTLLVTPLREDEPMALTPVMVHTLAHAWFESRHAWLEEGVAQLMSLLWVETNDGRQAGLDRLQQTTSALALAEPDFSKGDTAGSGQSLTGASNEIYYRTKAAAVLWMLRSIASDDALKQALQAYRKDKAADASDEGFELALEKASHENLRWFFDDWVYNDKGLPELSIANVAPRPAPAAAGRSDGWLVAVSVRNDGAAAAEVPVTVRSQKLTATERLRIPGHANAAIRIVFQDTPEEVVVGDGTVPEVSGNDIHTRKVVPERPAP